MMQIMDSIFWGVLCGVLSGLVISSFTQQLPIRWDYFLTREAHAHLGMENDDVPPPGNYSFSLSRRRSAWIVVACSTASILVFSAVGVSLASIPLMIFAYGLITAAIVDQEHMLLPDLVVQPLLWFGLISVAVTDPAQTHMHVAGAACGYCLLRWIPKVGEGDAKLCAAVGAWLGLSLMPMFVLVAGAFGTATGLFYYVKRGRSAACPFGPSLAAGAMALMACKYLNVVL